jgi:DNA-binding transcriptional ArsR family regulator
MVNTYFETIAIREEREAKILGSGSGWEILGLLRDNGMYGCTAEELSEELDLPLSTVYDTLNKLRAVGFIETRRFQKRIGAPDKDAIEEERRTGKQKKIYIECIHWGSSSFNIDFDRFLVEDIDKIIYNSDIDEQCSIIIDKIISRMKTTPDGKKFLPSTVDCPRCHFSHEAREYARALIFAIEDRIRKSEKIWKVFEKHGYIISH